MDLNDSRPMKNRNLQNGFIPMIIMLVLLVVAIIWFVYKKVSGAQ
jgi:cell division protein FtsB